MKKLTVRPSVSRFAEAMEFVLRCNDHKTGWQELCNECLIERMEDEFKELHEEFFHRTDYKTPDLPDINRMLLEAIDIANFAMMLFDNNRKHYNPEERD